MTNYLFHLHISKCKYIEQYYTTRLFYQYPRSLCIEYGVSGFHVHSVFSHVLTCLKFSQLLDKDTTTFHLLLAKLYVKFIVLIYIKLAAKTINYIETQYYKDKGG